MRLANSGVHREPGSCPKLVLQVDADQAAIRIFHVRRIQIWLAAVIENYAEKLAVLLREAVEARAQVIAIFHPRQCCLPAFIFGRAVLGRGAWEIQRTAAVVSAVEMKKRRDCKQQPGAKRPDPGKRDERIVLTIRV